MFKLTYRPKYDRDNAKTEYFNDTNSIGQALINIVNNEKEENSAMAWCERANFGDKVVRQQFGYKIECFNEETLKQEVELVVKEICKHFSLGYQFIGWDNDALTFDIDANLSWIKFNDNYGYYFVMNKDNYPNGNIEIFSTTNKDKNKFITDVIVGLEKVMRKQMNKTSRVQSGGSILCRVMTKSMCYEAVAPVTKSQTGNPMVRVIINNLNRGAGKNITVEYINGAVVPSGTGLGNAPKDFIESLYKIFQN